MYKFIFVDDEDLIRELFETILEFREYGFVLERSFSSAEQAIDYLSSNKDIALVITDIKMGNMSGIDFCEKIRKTNTDIELVIMSGYKEFEYAQKAIKQNVFDYILKPTTYSDINNLFKRLKGHLDNKSRLEVPKKIVTGDIDYHYTHLIDSVKKYIKGNYYNDISLDDVAHHVALNSSYLSRFFKQQTGSNFIDYLSNVRIQMAKEFLQDNSIKVYEVCGMVGYKNTQHFYKVFKSITGFTPTEFRNNIGITSKSDDNTDVNNKEK